MTKAWFRLKDEKDAPDMIQCWLDSGWKYIGAYRNAKQEMEHLFESTPTAKANITHGPALIRELHFTFS